MICKYCNQEMIKDDVDFRFKGNKDIYWLCECGGSCVEEIRFSKTFKLEWFKEDIENVKN